MQDFTGIWLAPGKICPTDHSPIRRKGRPVHSHTVLLTFRPHSSPKKFLIIALLDVKAYLVIRRVPHNQATFNSSFGSSGVTQNAADAAWKTYDYVVVGGGLTGLTVAARLAENPSTKVLVIEAGGDNRADPRVYDIYKYGQAFNSDLDWQFPTERGNIAGGKTLGGSSSINGAAWTRASKAQYDAWGSFLKPEESYLNWTWNSMFSYMNKAETFSPPNSEQRAKGADAVNDYHGYSGPVQITFPSKMYGGPQQGAFVKSIQSAVGIKKCADISGGDANCVAYTPNVRESSLNGHCNLYAHQSINWRESDHRSSAASAYLTPVESLRKNWLTLVNHQVTKLLWTTDNSKFAYGVEFRQTDVPCTPFQVYVTKEVILAAGAINTPAVLQRSGVGDPALMNPLGIPTVLNIPTVGKNLQEQTMSVLGSSSNGFDPKGDGPSDVIAFPNFYELFGREAAPRASEIRSSLDRWATEQASNALSAKALKDIYGIQATLILDNKGTFTQHSVMALY
ncbi:5634_t:CDS:2 [Acaulospora colombiana]|uniref:5634_t:CDS:1 n=1 Tax=Acaulospora colombiana TaxID=27376 RepID=A0ACA9L902_9GLOM|nr:5634_t:CDS:2 [Acaulospora colombiana]